MLACTDDLERVKRFGEWKSDAVHAYLYADHAASKTRASDMLRSKPILSSAQCSGPQPSDFCGHGRGEGCAARHHVADEGPDPVREERLRPLGRWSGASLSEVEKAYRKKCLIWHPDKWSTHSAEHQKKAEDTFKEIGLWEHRDTGHLRRSGPQPG